MLLLTLFACKAVEPAPADLDSLFHWFWDNFEDASDDELHEGVQNAFALVDLDALAEGPEDGALSDLTDEQIARVGVTDQTAADAAGMYLITTFACELPVLEAIVSAPDQDALYPDTYDSYERTYQDSRDDFLDRLSDELTWDLEYESTYLGKTYVANSVGSLRRAVTVDGDVSPHGDALFQRTYMPAPAVWEDDDLSYDQDYQIELYVDAGDGMLLHVYGLWKQAKYPLGTDSDNESVQRILLNNLAKWDETTAEHCANGGP